MPSLADIPSSAFDADALLGDRLAWNVGRNTYIIRDDEGDVRLRYNGNDIARWCASGAIALIGLPERAVASRLQRVVPDPWRVFVRPPRFGRRAQLILRFGESHTQDISRYPCVLDVNGDLIDSSGYRTTWLELLRLDADRTRWELPERPIAPGFPRWVELWHGDITTVLERPPAPLPRPAQTTRYWDVVRTDAALTPEGQGPLARIPRRLPPTLADWLNTWLGDNSRAPTVDDLAVPFCPHQHLPSGVTVDDWCHMYPNMAWTGVILPHHRYYPAAPNSDGRIYCVCGNAEDISMHDEDCMQPVTPEDD